MSSTNETISVIVYYDAYVADCNVGACFNEKRSDLQCLEKKNPTKDRPKSRSKHNRSHLSIPITTGSDMFNYQAVTINDDEDIDGMFNVYN